MLSGASGLVSTQISQLEDLETTVYSDMCPQNLALHWVWNEA
ncbi:2657_t:CDS:2, partial [Gigaspora rosea]